MGTLMLSACKKLGLAGVIVDGAIRDRLELLELDFPVFSAGFNPAGPTKFVPGRINHTISAGGTTVHPGDLVVGDADGVVVIERAKADRKSTRLNSSHSQISYAVFCLKKKNRRPRFAA